MSWLANYLMRIIDSAYFAIVVVVGVAGLVLAEEIRSPSRPAVPKAVRETKPLDRIDVRPQTPPPDANDYSDGDLFVHSRSGDAGRGWAETDFSWQPTELAHHPPYFDDVPLERYGQTADRKLQPIASGARFFGTVLTLPYRVARERPLQRVFTHGLDAPGNDTACVRQKWLR